MRRVDAVNTAFLKLMALTSGLRYAMMRYRDVSYVCLCASKQIFNANAREKLHLLPTSQATSETSN